MEQVLAMKCRICEAGRKSRAIFSVGSLIVVTHLYQKPENRRSVWCRLKFSTIIISVSRLINNTNLFGQHFVSFLVLDCIRFFENFIESISFGDEIFEIISKPRFIVGFRDYHTKTCT